MDKDIKYVAVFYGEICNVWIPRTCIACKEKERDLCTSSFLGLNIIIDNKEIFKDKVLKIEEIEEYLKNNDLLDERQSKTIQFLKMADFDELEVDKTNVEFEGESRLDCVVKKPQIIKVILPY